MTQAGDVELILDQVIRSTAALTGGAGDVQYRFLIDGLPLDMMLPRAAARAAARASANPRVVVSAGHGWYWNEQYSAWHLQRDHYWGIVEDVVNWDFASGVQAALRRTRFDVRLARNPDPLALPGRSGHPAWQEGAMYFIRGLGAPGDVWNIGINDYARDINSPPSLRELDRRRSRRLDSQQRRRRHGHRNVVRRDEWLLGGEPNGSRTS